MKLKIIPKSEQDLSKFFLMIFPISLTLSLSIQFLRDAYFSFSNLLPNNQIFNYGFLDKLYNQSMFGLTISISLMLVFSYLFSKSIGRLLTFFPLIFLTAIGLVGTEFLDVILNFVPNVKSYSLGNSTALIILKIAALSGLIIFASINLLAKKEAVIFHSAQFIFGGLLFYLISLFIVNKNQVVFSDVLLTNTFYTSTHIYVTLSLIFLGIIHFLMTKTFNSILFSRTLASITFWGFLFLVPWSTAKFYYGSVLPNWLENVSIYLSFSILIPLLAFVVNYLKTIATRDSENSNEVLLKLVNFATFIFIFTNLLNIVSGFENLLPILGLTNYVNLISQGYLASMFFAIISLSYYLIPKLFGREVTYNTLDNFSISGLKIGYILLLLNNLFVGINSGYIWNAGANTGNPTIYGEGFNLAWSLIGINYSLSTFISLILFICSTLFFLSLVKAITSGNVTKVEEMVASNE